MRPEPGPAPRYKGLFLLQRHGRPCLASVVIVLLSATVVLPTAMVVLPATLAVLGQRDGRCAEHQCGGKEQLSRSSPQLREAAPHIHGARRRCEMKNANSRMNPSCEISSSISLGVL